MNNELIKKLFKIFSFVLIMICISFQKKAFSLPLCEEKYCIIDNYGCYINEESEKNYIMFWSEETRLFFMGNSTQPYENVVAYCNDCNGRIYLEDDVTPIKPTSQPTIQPTNTPLPSEPIYYIVQAGDNCWSIAVDKFGVNYELFMNANNMTICNIGIGDEVIIPNEYTPIKPTSQPTIQPTNTPLPSEPIYYIVQAGDNCWSIAVDKFGVNYELFMNVNNMTTCNIGIGDEVIIPNEYTPIKPTSQPTIQPTNTPLPSEPFSYIVQAGDNCWSIAVDKFGVNYELFMMINNMNSTCNIGIGDEVIIPGYNQEMPTRTPIPLEQYTIGQKIEYTVELNETYQKIASKFNTTLDSLQKLNNIEDMLYFPRYGDVLIVAVNLVTPTPSPVPFYKEMLSK